MLNMKPVLLVVTILFLLTGCQIFDQQTPTSNSDESQPAVDTSHLAQGGNLVGPNELPENRIGVFNEKAISSNYDYPASTLGWEVSYDDLDEAIDDYYVHEFDDDEKEFNQTPINPEDLSTLQNTLDNNDILQSLQATVDQVEITLGGETNYVARVVVPMTYQEAENTQAKNDILLLNESLAHLGGQRIILLEYYNKDEGIVTPIHLTNNSRAIFFNQNQAQLPE